MSRQPIAIDRLSKMIAIKADDAGALPAEIELLQTGMWDAPYHGMFMVTEEDIDQYIDNFKHDVRPSSSSVGLPIDIDHDAGEAAGWLKSLFKKPNDHGGMSLWSKVSWSSLGEQKLLGGNYKFFSPEFVPQGYVDPEGRFDDMKNVLIGGGLTNRPLFKSLTPIMASDGTAQQRASEAEDDKLYISVKEQPVELEDIRKKPVTDLSVEEKQFLADNVDKLTEEEKAVHGFTAAATEETPEEAAPTAESETPAPEAPAPEAPSEPVQANDGRDKGMVTISASDLAKLQESAKKADEMFAQNQAILAADKTKAWVDTGVFKAGESGGVTSFYLSLTDAQRKSFEETVVPAIQTEHVEADELGDAGASHGMSAESIIIKANELAKSEGINIAEATRRVVSENPDLGKSHNKELKETN